MEDKEKTVEEKLDLILDYYRNTYEKGLVGDKIVYDELRRKTVNNQLNKFQSLEKHIIDDKYIEEDKYGIRILTVKGLLFEGYEQRKINADIEAERVRRIESELRASSLKLAVWTERLVYAGWAAGIGSVGLLFWEMWSRYYPIACNH